MAYTSAYCLQADIEHVLTQAGVSLAADDNGDGVVDATDQTHIADAIERGSETCAFYLWGKYADAWLRTSPSVRHWSSVFAAYHLRGRGGNPPAEVLETWAEEATERLQMIHDGGFTLPGIPLRRSLAPAWSNISCDPLRNNFRVIRVERNNSGTIQTGLSQNPDWRDAFSVEI